MYNYSIFIGRFQPFHVGHLHNITEALKVSDKLILFVGSAFSCPSMKDPFSFLQRKEMIQADLEHMGIDLSRVIIEPLQDFFYDEEHWREQLVDTVVKYTKKEESVVLVGHSKDSSSYYLKAFPNWEYLEVSNFKQYSATYFREDYYQEKIKLEYLVSQSPQHGSHKLLLDFLQTDDYALVCDEFLEIRKYQKTWSNSPFPPIFVTVDAMVVINNKILLIKRGNQPGKTRWALPGGFIEESETALNSAIRELFEETQIDIYRQELSANNQGVEMFDFPQRSVIGRAITHCAIFHFKKEFDVLPEVKASDDALDVKWVDLKVVLEEYSSKMSGDHHQIIGELYKKYIKDFCVNTKN